MGNRHLWPVSAIVILLVFITAVSSWFYTQRRIGATSSYGVLPPAPNAGDPLAGIYSDFTVGEDFSSRLPLVIMDTENRRSPVSSVWSREFNRYVPIPGIDPYVQGNIRVINTGGVNTLSAMPEAQSRIVLKRRGSSSMVFEKAQYMVKLVTSSGDKNNISLLGMGAENEWILNGSMADKSMMRNYLAFRIASQFMPYTPDARYCEVLYYENGVYRYEGVYLLMENVKQGGNRVAITRSGVFDPFPSFIVRRDRYDDDGLNLDTWLTRNDYTEKYISLIYPSKFNVTENTVKYITDTISRIEECLYSDDPSVFLSYRRYIDADSFADYFIFNDFFSNYDAGEHSTYMYSDSGGKLRIGPVWDFDNAMDNYLQQPMAFNQTVFQKHLYFSRMVLDADFISRLERRYAELRRGPLNSQFIGETIDSIAAFLGPAVDREWARWGHIYLNKNSPVALSPYTDSEGDLLIRESDEYRVEIYRLKTALLRHGQEMLPAISSLENITVFHTDIAGYRDFFLVIIIAAFAAPLIYIARR
jgi:hypothetical protein